MSTPSHPSSLPSSSTSSLPISRISEGKEEEVADELDDEVGESTASEPSELHAQLEAKEGENEELRRELALYRARYKDDEKEERRRVIVQRVSLTAQRDVRGVTIVNESLPPPRPIIGSSPFRSPVPVPHRQGRLTLSPPTMNSPVLRGKPSPTETLNPSNPDPPADQGEESGVEMTQKQREGLIKSMGGPSTFSGDKGVDKIPDVRDWVEDTDRWLRIHVGKEVNKGLLVIVEGLLKGGAATWLTNQTSQLTIDLRARGMKGQVEWHEVREGFIEEFEGPQYRSLIREELKKLQLWKGKCKSIPLFNSEFDRLSRRLYPSGQDLEAFIPVLAEEYGNCLRNSDEDLWSRCVILTIPASIAEWRERAASCLATREVLKAQRGTWSSSHQSKPTSSSLAQLTTEGEGVSDEGQTDTTLNAFRQRQEGQTGQERKGFQGKGKGASQPGALGWKSDSFLTEEEYTSLRKQGKCFYCFLKGHLSWMCPKKKEPRRHPTAEELKA